MRNDQFGYDISLSSPEAVAAWDGMVLAFLAHAAATPEYLGKVLEKEPHFAMAHAAGVPMLASSDASFANPYLFHGFSLLDELDLYVEIGLTPREALHTAIVAPPRFFGLSDQDGTIAPGRRADLVLLDANPLGSLATLRRPRAVISGGQVLDRAELDAMAAALVEAGR